MYCFGVEGDFGVLARDVAADQLQVVSAAAADREHGLLERHEPAPECIGHFETPNRHACGPDLRG